jgi:hypothetical protein
MIIETNFGIFKYSDASNRVQEINVLVFIEKEITVALSGTHGDVYENG